MSKYVYCGIDYDSQYDYHRARATHYFRLIEDGMHHNVAAKEVGVCSRTARAWRNGRQV
jgi:hypothetical protein